jgi:hypothetical protein
MSAYTHIDHHTARQRCRVAIEDCHCKVAVAVLEVYGIIWTCTHTFIFVNIEKSSIKLLLPVQN